jgi:redox-sensing transcriptional repressor
MEAPRHEQAPYPAVRRLSLYLRQFEAFERAGQATVSSKQLGESLALTDAQVRKDLAYFGQFGKAGLGYPCAEMTARLRAILGTDRVWPVALVGAGNLGMALAAYRGFERRGFRVVALFDIDPAKLGRKHAGLTIQPMEELKATVKREQIRLAMLAVPGDVAQVVAEQMVSAGVRGIVNFAPVVLNLPREVSVSTVDLAEQLEQLAFAVSTQSAR